MPPDAVIIAVAAAVKSIFDYQTMLLEKVPEQGKLVAEQVKPWLKLAEWFNKALRIDGTPPPPSA